MTRWWSSSGLDRARCPKNLNRKDLTLSETGRQPVVFRTLICSVSGVQDPKYYHYHLMSCSGMNSNMCSKCATSNVASQCMIDVLEILHRLHLPERVNFKLALMAYRVQHGMVPAYLNQLVSVSDLPGRRRLRSSSNIYTRAVRSVISSDNHWPSLVSCCSRKLSGTLCLSMSSHHHLLQPFANGWLDILVSTVISRYHHLTLLSVYVGLHNSYSYFSYVKNL